MLAAWFVVPGGGGSGLGAQSPSEYEVKAAFLYNFAKFVEWPPEAFPDASAPIVIGVVRNDYFNYILARTVAGKVVQGRKFLVRLWKRNQGSPNWQILFISSSEGNALAEILQSIKGSSMLTVGETQGFAARGGMINFILSDNRVRFEINQKSAQSAGLKISSKLLALATSVWE